MAASMNMIAGKTNQLVAAKLRLTQRSWSMREAAGANQLIQFLHSAWSHAVLHAFICLHGHKFSSVQEKRWSPCLFISPERSLPQSERICKSKIMQIFSLHVRPVGWAPITPVPRTSQVCQPWIFPNFAVATQLNYISALMPLSTFSFLNS